MYLTNSSTCALFSLVTYDLYNMNDSGWNECKIVLGSLYLYSLSMAMFVQLISTHIIVALVYIALTCSGLYSMEFLLV